MIRFSTGPISATVNLVNRFPGVPRAHGLSIPIKFCQVTLLGFPLFTSQLFSTYDRKKRHILSWEDSSQHHWRCPLYQRDEIGLLLLLSIDRGHLAVRAFCTLNWYFHLSTSSTGSARAETSWWKRRPLKSQTAPQGHRLQVYRISRLLAHAIHSRCKIPRLDYLVNQSEHTTVISTFQSE